MEEIERGPRGPGSSLCDWAAVYPATSIVPNHPRGFCPESDYSAKSYIYLQSVQYFTVLRPHLSPLQ